MGKGRGGEEKGRRKGKGGERKGKEGEGKGREGKGGEGKGKGGTGEASRILVLCCWQPYRNSVRPSVAETGRNVEERTDQRYSDNDNDDDDDGLKAASMPEESSKDLIELLTNKMPAFVR